MQSKYATGKLAKSDEFLSCQLPTANCILRIDDF